MRPMSFLLVSFWSSGPGLRSQWDTLAHFLEKGAKRITNGGPTGAPNKTFCNTFSICFLLCGCCCGSLAETGFWVFVLQRLVGVRRAEYGFYLDFYCASTSYIWEQSLIFCVSSPIGTHFWRLLDSFLVVLGVLFESWRRPRCHQIFVTILAPFWDSPPRGENQPVGPNGLARGSLNFRSMD